MEASRSACHRDDAAADRKREFLPAWLQDTYSEWEYSDAQEVLEYVRDVDAGATMDEHVIPLTPRLRG
jgi:hypothetical protein